MLSQQKYVFGSQKDEIMPPLSESGLNDAHLQNAHSRSYTWNTFSHFDASNSPHSRKVKYGGEL